MKERRLKIGILFPDGEIKSLMFGAPTKDGIVYGVSYADTHIQALPETHSISFHITDQKSMDKEHLGRIIRDGDYEDLQYRALNPRLITDEGLDEQVVYISKRGYELFNQPPDFMLETETEQEQYLILDLPRFFNQAYHLALELSQNLTNIFGLCTAKEILINNDYEAGFTSKDTALIEVEGELYEVNIRAYLDLTDSDNPLLEVLGPIGLPSLMPELKKRLREIFEEKKESFKDTSYKKLSFHP